MECAIYSIKMAHVLWLNAQNHIRIMFKIKNKLKDLDRVISEQWLTEYDKLAATRNMFVGLESMHGQKWVDSMLKHYSKMRNQLLIRKPSGIVRTSN